MRHTAPMTTPAPLAQGAARRVEDAFAALHGADSALLLPGLVAATTGTLLALTNPGGHVIASDQTSDPLRGVLTRELAGLGRTVTFVDCTDADAVAAAVRPETQVVYAQSLSDPLMRPAPLNEIAIHAQMNDLLLVVDNTALSPAELRPLDTGAVIVIEDTAPFLDGWGDVGAAFVTGLDRYLPRIAEQCSRFGGEVHDCKTADSLLKGIEAGGVIADKAYDTNALRETIAAADMTAVIPSTSRRKHPIPHDAEVYKTRNRIERCFNKLKHFRRIATRYDRRSDYFLAFVQIASALIWMR